MAQSPVSDKVKPDEGTLIPGAFESLASQKVQLDIDDAPFLMDLPEDIPPPAVQEEKEEETPKKSRKKLFLLIGIALVLLALAGGLAYYFFFTPSEPTGLEPIILVVPSNPEDNTASAPAEQVVELEPFWVPVVDENGKTRFAVFTFVLSTYDTTAYEEITQQTIRVRDTIYYYLTTRPYDYLVNARNLPVIREEIVNALQKDTLKGRLNNLYFDSIMVQ